MNKFIFTRKLVVEFAAYLILFSSSVMNLSAQDEADKPFKSLGVGINTGSNGYGVSLITKLTPHIVARLGFDGLGVTYKPNDLTFDADYGGHDVTVKGNAIKAQFANSKLLFDYYPFPNGIFSVSAGLFVGKSKIKLEGYASEKFNFEDIVITPDSKGYFDAYIDMGNSIKPYFGLGLGRTLAKKRVGFKFDLGAIYQGHYNLKSDYMTSESTSSNNALTDQIPKSILDFWPVINFSLSYRFQ